MTDPQAPHATPPAPELGAPEPVRIEPGPEPGNPTTARLAGLAVVLLIAVVAALQQFAGSASESAASTGAAARGILPPTTQFELTAKVFTKITYAFEKSPVWGRQTVSQLDGTARTPEDRLRVAIVAGELLGPEAAEERLNDLNDDLEEGTELAEDAAAVEGIYVDGQSPGEGELDQLRTNHGWFGRLAIAGAKGPESDEHKRLVSGGQALVAIMLAVALGGGLALLAGAALLTAGAIVWANNPRFSRFRPGPRGGSVLIETVGVFVAAFLLLKLSTAVVAAIWPDTEVPTWFAMLCQWLLLLTLLWPWARGMPLGRAMHALGLHRGQGVLTEMGCGLVGYLACVPILVVGVIVSMILLMLYALGRRLAGLPEPPPPSNQVIEMVARTPVALAVLLFLLASLWAPLAEESIFRGALYGHLRRSWHWFPAAVVTALGFGLMHGYMILLLGPVIALGVGFSLMREWRGSLIAPMTAHCMHNAMVLALLLVVFRIVGD